MAGWLLPMGLMGLIYFMMMRRVSSKGGPLNLGRSRAKVFDANTSEKVTFAAPCWSLIPLTVPERMPAIFTGSPFDSPVASDMIAE